MRDRTNDYRYETPQGPASNLLEYLMLGGREMSVIRELADHYLDRVNSRVDCADFTAAYMIRILFCFENEIGEELTSEFEKALLAFPYSDCGGHSMCTWTENHRLYTAGTEHLLAQRLQDTVFGDGGSSFEHYVHSSGIILEWCESVEKYGFSEWGSNNYYSETMAAIANILQFSTDYDIHDAAKRAMELLLTDIFSRTHYNEGYIFNPACARAYADNRTSSMLGNYVGEQIKALLGEKLTRFKEKEGCVFALMQSRSRQGEPAFTVPDKLLRYLREQEKENAVVQGVDIASYRSEGLDEYSGENLRYAFAAGAISDYRLICRSMRYLRETGMIENGMLAKMKPFGNPLLWRTGLLRLIKRFVPVVWDASAMEQGRVYTYTRPGYSLSAAFNYHVGQASFQQNSFAVNISQKISLFANSPFKAASRTGSPGYWTGSGTSPQAAAYRNVLMSIFDPKHARFGEKRTHLFFPTGLFDRADLCGLDEGILLARTGNVNICIRTNPGVYFISAGESLANDRALYQDMKIPEKFYNMEYDLMNEAKGYHWYVFEVDDTLGFDDFRQKMLSRKFIFDEKNAAAQYFAEHAYRLSFRGEFSIDGKAFEPEFVTPAQLLDRLE